MIFSTVKQSNTLNDTRSTIIKGYFRYTGHVTQEIRFKTKCVHENYFRENILLVR